MKYVENEIFYHLQNPKIKGLEIGKTYTIGEDFNPHTKFLYYTKFPETISDQQKLALFQHYHAFTIEELFENIRLEHFPEKPSRKKCLFLADLNSINYWHKVFPENNSLVKILCNGTIMRADPCFLTHRFYGGFAEHTALSHKYWQEIVLDEKYVEYLFVGNIHIVDIINFNHRQTI